MATEMARLDIDADAVVIDGKVHRRASGELPKGEELIDFSHAAASAKR